MSDPSIGVVVGSLGVDSLVSEPLLAACEALKSGLQLAVDTVVQTRHRWEKLWCQYTDIVDQAERVTSVEADSERVDDCEAEQSLLKRVSVGQVGDHRLTWHGGQTVLH